MSFFTKAKNKLSHALSSSRSGKGSRKEKMEAALDAEDDSTPPGTPTRQQAQLQQPQQQQHQQHQLQGSNGSFAAAAVKNQSFGSGSTPTRVQLPPPAGSPSNNSFALLASEPSATSSPGPSSTSNSKTKASRTPTKSTEMSAHDAAIMDTIMQDLVDVAELRKHCWGGCPHDVRRDCWFLLSGYAPADHATRESVVKRKRGEYANYVQNTYAGVDWDEVLSEGAGNSGTNNYLNSSAAARNAAIGAEDVAILKQIRKDIPRTTHPFPFLDFARGHLMLERIIFIWAKRHPACGYVQGMLDIIMPICFVVLAHRVCESGRVSQLLAMKEIEVQAQLLDVMTADDWMKVEADIFWLSSRMLGNIQENFTFDQAGAHAMVKKLEAILRSIDPPLVKHIVDVHNITFPEFAFRWMNCLLLRELTPIQGLRLFDTYMSEESRFSDLHVYVCASLMQKWSPTLLRESDFARVVQFLQKPPLFHLQDRDMDEIISQAYLHQQIFESAPRHLMLNASNGSTAKTTTDGFR